MVPERVVSGLVAEIVYIICHLDNEKLMGPPENTRTCMYLKRFGQNAHPTYLGILGMEMSPILFYRFSYIELKDFFK